MRHRLTCYGEIGSLGSGVAGLVVPLSVDTEAAITLSTPVTRA